MIPLSKLAEVATEFDVFDCSELQSGLVHNFVPFSKQLRPLKFGQRFAAFNFFRTFLCANKLVNLPNFKTIDGTSPRIKSAL